jgi:hypothetical protein
MIGLRRWTTSAAGRPRKARISFFSRRRMVTSDSLLGLISSFGPLAVWYRRTLKDRKSNPSSMVTMRVFAGLRWRPFGASHAVSRARTRSACSRLWHRATRSSA